MEFIFIYIFLVLAGSKVGEDPIAPCMESEEEMGAVEANWIPVLTPRDHCFLPNSPRTDVALHLGHKCAFEELGIRSHIRNHILHANYFFVCFLPPTPSKIISESS